MSDQTLAQFSMLSLYSAMGCSRWRCLRLPPTWRGCCPLATRPPEHVEEYELVAAGGVRGAEPGLATSAAAYRPGDGGARRAPDPPVASPRR